MASLFTWCESIRLFLFAKTKVCQGRAGEPFSLEEELKTQIKAVWKDCTTDLKPLRKAIKQFVPRLRAVKKNRDIVSKRYLVDWIIHNSIVKLYIPFLLVQSSNEEKKNRKLKQKINNSHFLLRFHNTAFDVIFAQVIFSMLGASSYNFENYWKYYLHLRSTEGQWLIV